MSALDLFGLLVPVTYLVMVGIESLIPARQFPNIPYWRLKGFCFLTVQGLLATLTPLVIPEAWLERHRLIDLTGIGVAGGAVLGYAVLSLVNYVWHRSAHTFPVMWRLFHQIHHSPQRMDMSGAALFHPLETIAFFSIATVVTTLVLGLDPVAAAATGYIAAFYGYFQHMNVRTPQMAWLSDPAAGGALHPSPTRCARLQLRRPADLGHAVRHLPQSGKLRRRRRFRQAGNRPLRRDARLRRRQ